MKNGEALYKRFLNGDESAFDEIIREYRNGLTFFINRFVCDTFIAEDIAADVFAYLIVYPKRYNFTTSLKTYLYMLSRSRALDYLRKQKRRQENELSEFIKSDEDIEKSVLDGERKRIISNALNALNEELKIAVHLVYIEELSYKETAKVMKKTVKQVDNLVYRAKKELRILLEKEGEGLL